MGSKSFILFIRTNIDCIISCILIYILCGLLRPMTIFPSWDHPSPVSVPSLQGALPSQSFAADSFLYALGWENVLRGNNFANLFSHSLLPMCKDIYERSTNIHSETDARRVKAFHARDESSLGVVTSIRPWISPFPIPESCLSLSWKECLSMWNEDVWNTMVFYFGWHRNGIS